MKREIGQIEVWLTSSIEHKVHVHQAKLTVVKSDRNRFIGDYDTVEEALESANSKGIEVKEIKER